MFTKSKPVQFSYRTSWLERARTRGLDVFWWRCLTVMLQWIMSSFSPVTLNWQLSSSGFQSMILKRSWFGSKMDSRNFSSAFSPETDIFHYSSPGIRRERRENRERDGQKKKRCAVAISALAAFPPVFADVSAEIKVLKHWSRLPWVPQVSASLICRFKARVWGSMCHKCGCERRILCLCVYDWAEAVFFLWGLKMEAPVEDPQSQHAPRRERSHGQDTNENLKLYFLFYKRLQALKIK